MLKTSVGNRTWFSNHDDPVGMNKIVNGQVWISLLASILNPTAFNSLKKMCFPRSKFIKFHINNDITI